MSKPTRSQKASTGKSSKQLQVSSFRVGMMKLKKKEFEDLKQGSMSVNEYAT
jgi:hypothetical protein